MIFAFLPTVGKKCSSYFEKPKSVENQKLSTFGKNVPTLAIETLKYFIHTSNLINFPEINFNFDFKSLHSYSNSSRSHLDVKLLDIERVREIFLKTMDFPNDVP